jgi:hypothetical protein
MCVKMYDAVPCAMHLKLQLQPLYTFYLSFCRLVFNQVLVITTSRSWDQVPTTH